MLALGLQEYLLQDHAQDHPLLRYTMKIVSASADEAELGQEEDECCLILPDVSPATLDIALSIAYSGVVDGVSRHAVREVCYSLLLAVDI